MSACREPPDRPPLVEIGNVPELWVDGIGKVEPLGGGAYRILLYRVHRPPQGDGPVEHEVVASILTTLAHAQAAIMLLRMLVEGAVEQVQALLQ